MTLAVARSKAKVVGDFEIANRTATSPRVRDVTTRTYPAPRICCSVCEVTSDERSDHACARSSLPTGMPTENRGTDMSEDAHG